MKSLRYALLALGFMGIGAVAAVTTAAVAQDGPPACAAPFVDEVGLTDEQAETLRGILDAHREGRQADRETRRAEREELEAAFVALDRQAVVEHIEAHHAERLADQRELMGALLDFAETLEPEQRQLLAEHLPMGGPPHGGHGMRHGQGMGPGQGMGQGMGRGQGGPGRGMGPCGQ